MSFATPSKVLSLEELQELNRGIDTATMVIQETLNDQEQYNDSIDEAVQIADTLTQISGHVGEAQELKSNEVRVIDLAVEHFCKRLGYTSKQAVGLENHVSNTQRISVSLEGIVSSIWEAIKSAFRKLKEWVIAAWEAVFGKKKKVEEKIVIVQGQRESVNRTIPESEQNKTSEKINAQIKDTPAKETSEQPVFSERLVSYFRKEDGSDCLSPKEIQEKTEKLLDSFADGKHSRNVTQAGNDIDHIRKVVDKFFDNLDEISQGIKAGDKEKYDEQLEAFEKTAFGAYKEIFPLEAGTLLSNPFDHHFRIAGKNPAFTMINKEYFKILTHTSTLELPTKEFKDKVLFSVVKLGEFEKKGESKKILDANRNLLDYVNNRVDKSSKMYNEASIQVKDGTSRDLKIGVFGMLITTESSRLRNAVRMALDLQKTYMDYFVTLMNHLIEYVRLSDKILINKYGETTVVF